MTFKNLSLIVSFNNTSFHYKSMNPVSKERVIIEASARILTSRYHKDLSFEKAALLVERNRTLDRPALYIGANKDIADFLATGCKGGVFVDPEYSEIVSPAGQTNMDLFAEDFRSHLIRISDVSGFSIRQEGDIKKSGKWIMKFDFCGEEKTVVCYGAALRFPRFRFNPPEPESGVSHLTTVHFPTEWIAALEYYDIFNTVVRGGHLETWYPKELQTFLTQFLRFELFHKDNSNDAIKARHGEILIDEVSIYDKLRSYAIFRKKE